MDGQRIAGGAWFSRGGWFFWVFLCASQALGNGVVRDGVGAISIGRGATNIAHSDNTVVLLDNPAGMMGIEGQRMFQLGVDGLITDLHYQETQFGQYNEDSATIRPMGLPEFGLIRKSDDGQWAYGAAIVAPAGFGAHFNLIDPVFGPQAYSSFGALVKVLPGVACQVTDRLAVGATLGVGVSQAALEGPYYVQTGPFSGVPVLADVRGTGAALVWSVGAQYELTERTTLGFTYQSESRFGLEGDATIEILGLPAVEYDAQLDLTWPQSVGVGVSHQVNCCHRLSADFVWIGWENAFDTMGMHLSSGGVPVLSDQFPFDWQNSMSFRFGYEYFPTDCTVFRTGYVYNVNQVPDETLTPYLPAILEHAFSVGWGVKRACYDFDIAYQFSYGPDRSVGNSGLVGGDFDSSEFSASAHWLAIALTRRF